MAKTYNLTVWLERVFRYHPTHFLHCITFIMLSSQLLSLSALVSSTLAFKPCPVQGPDCPAPSGLATDPVFEDVLNQITQSVENATEQSIAELTNLKANETSYSVIVFDVNSTVLSYHHTADAIALAPESVSHVDGTNSP